ncbi:MAG: hypothetical protein WCK91_02060 [bacterium]
MRYIATLLTLIIGVIYWPLNLFYLWVQKWYFQMREEDKVIYWLFAPFYWALVAIVSILSIPYEALTKLAGH